jgi:hypothetical protein
MEATAPRTGKFDSGSGAAPAIPYVEGQWEKIVMLSEMYRLGAEEALNLWSDPDWREQCGVSLDEAAAELIRDTALLRRYSGEEDVLTVLAQWPVEYRRDLVVHAARHLAKRWIRCAAQRIFDNDMGYTEMEQLKDLLLERDAMEESWWALRAIAKDFLADPDDYEVNDLVCRSKVAIAEADSFLQAEPETVGLAAGIFTDLLPHCKIVPGENRTCRIAGTVRQIGQKQFWWFYEAQEWRRQAEEEVRAPLSDLLPE